MGGFEGFKLKLILWHIQNVKYLKQEEIKDVLMLRQRQKTLQPVQLQVSLIYFIMLTGMKENFYKGKVVAEKELAL